MIKKILSTILLTIFVSNIAFAQEDVTVIKKGTPAPYDGILLTEDKARELRNYKIERDNYKLLNESLERSIVLHTRNENIYQTKINLLLEQNDKLAKSLYDAKDTTNLERIMYFSIGVIATGFAVYGATKIVK